MSKQTKLIIALCAFIITPLVIQLIYARIPYPWGLWFPNVTLGVLFMVLWELADDKEGSRRGSLIFALVVLVLAHFGFAWLLSKMQSLWQYGIALWMLSAISWLAVPFWILGGSAELKYRGKLKHQGVFTIIGALILMRLCLIILAWKLGIQIQPLWLGLLLPFLLSVPLLYLSIKKTI